MGDGVSVEEGLACNLTESASKQMVSTSARLREVRSRIFGDISAMNACARSAGRRE